MSKQSGVEQLDEARLATYLAEHIPGFSGPVTATKFAGGQSNPTFKLQTANTTYVLRRQPPGKLLKSAHAVDREYRVIKALENTDVPVAKVYHLCEDTDVIGSMFYVMEFMDGNVYWDSSLPDVNDTQTRRTMYQNMVKVMATMHCVNVDEVGLGDYGRPGNYFERQISRWTKQYRLSEIQVIPEMDTLIAWLEANIPADDGKVSLVHGDYRMDNLKIGRAHV